MVPSSMCKSRLFHPQLVIASWVGNSISDTSDSMVLFIL